MIVSTPYSFLYQTTYLGQETLVKGTETLLLEHGSDSGESPVVLGDLTRDLGGVLNSTLDDVEGSVENSSESTTNGTRDEIVCDLRLLRLSLGEHLSDLENAAEVTSVPEDVAPHGTLKALVESERTLVLDCLENTVDHAVVLSGGGLVLETNLDELEGNDDERLSGTSGSTSQDGERLVHLVHAKHLTVDLAPFIVGSELGSTLGSLHEDGGGDTTVKSGETGAYC